MVAIPQALEGVLFGPNGLATGLRPGQILIDMSTIGPSAFRSLASRLPRGVTAVDAPVRGSVPEATAGTLHVFVGASGRDFERVGPILKVLGDVRHVGAPGTGAAMKLVVNLALGTAIVAFGEALALAALFGLERDDTLDILAQSPIGPIVAANRAPLGSVAKKSSAVSDVGSTGRVIPRRSIPPVKQILPLPRTPPDGTGAM